MSQPPQPGGHPFPPQPGGDPQQPGGYAQQGGYPPQGGYPQQQQFGQPGAYPQQQYGQPYGAPQKNNKPLIFGAIGVLVIGIAVTLILVLTGGSGPRDTVEDFISGVQNKDIEAVNATICDEKRKMKPGVFERAKDLPQDIKILEVKEEGDTATVTLEATVRGERDTDDFTLRKKDGNWCIGSM